MTFSLLVSQIGYGPDDPKVAVVRADQGATGEPGAVVVVDAITGTERARILVEDHMETWGLRLWRADFSSVREPGRYRLELPASGVTSNEFDIEEDILLTRTLVPCSIDTLDARVGGKLGWQDCAFDGRGLESHAIVVLGLVDVLLELPRLDPALRAQLADRVRHGADYLLACQRADGSFMNEYYIGRDLTVWTLCALACVALARAAEVLSSGKLLDGAKVAWEWISRIEPQEADLRNELESSRRIFGGYAPWQPPATRRARDLLLLLRAATELYRNTNDLVYGAEARRLARIIRGEYQIREPGGNGLYGHFLAWPGSGIRQRAWEHAGWGYNCGAVLPDDISGFVNLLDLFPESEDVPMWRATLHEYAYGYLVPASAGTPFGIYPLGDFEGEVRYFGPAWHGFNGVYGQVARTCMLLGRLFGDQALERLAHANLQWVAGANAGVEVAPGQYQGVSWISGIGELAAPGWSGIPGSIGNGFSSTPQFRLEHLDDSTDAPSRATNEDWLVHNGSWLSGLAHVSASPRVKVRVAEDGVGVPAEVVVELGDLRVSATANERGIVIVENVPHLTSGKVRASWGGRSIERVLAPVAGATATAMIDFSALVTLTLDVVSRRVEVRNEGAHIAVSMVVETADSAESHELLLGEGRAEHVRVPVAAGQWFRVTATSATCQVVLEPHGTEGVAAVPQ